MLINVLSRADVLFSDAADDSRFTSRFNTLQRMAFDEALRSVSSCHLHSLQHFIISL